MTRVQQAATRSTRRPRPATKPETLADLVTLARALGVPPERVRLDPPPGTATEADVLTRCEQKPLCELVDGTLVDKPMGAPESHLAMRLVGRLEMFLDAHDLGFTGGPDMITRFAPGVVRLPDVSFVSWARRPERTVPPDPVSGLIPNLAVEILSPSNTRAEMAKKLAEYFAAGVELAWVIDPVARTAEAYTAADVKVTLVETDALDGGAVLPGFTLPLATLFARLERPAAAKPKRPRKKS